MINFSLGKLALRNANFKRPVMVTGLLLAFFIGIRPAFSQRTVYHHNTMWVRTFVSDRLTERLTGEFFFQYRTQNRQSGSLNIFQTHYLHSYALSLRYTLPHDFNISVTPFCYFVNQRLGAMPNERPVREYRWVARAEKQLKLNHFQLFNRLGLEYRWRNLFDAGVYVPNWRIRYMFRVTKPIHAAWLRGKAFNLITYDEVMVQFGKAMRTFPTLFDQNRVFVGASFEPAKNIRVELGYLYIRQQRSTREQFDDQNALMLTLRFDHVFSQFRKKDDN